MTEDDYVTYNKSSTCHKCEKPLNNDRVKDHCHMTGKTIGAAHNDCNRNRNYNNYNIPVLCHNGKGYDSHFIINEIGKVKEINRINIIPKTEEKFVCYNFNN